MSWSTAELRVWLAHHETGLSPQVKIFLLTIPRWCFFCGSFILFLSCICYVFVCLCLLMPCGHLLGKGWPLGSRLWCLIECEVVTFPLVSLVMCGAGLYWFLIFALFLTFKTDNGLMQVKSIAECSNWRILQYFKPSLSYHFVIKIFVLFIFEWLVKTGFTVYACIGVKAYKQMRQ